MNTTQLPGLIALSLVAFDRVTIHTADGNVIELPPTATQEAHDRTPTCGAARGAHWTAHTLACRSERDLVNVQRKAAL